jgi:dynein heavy chain
MAKGNKQAMAKYNEQQVKQVTRLIEVTRTDLSKVRAWLARQPPG